MTHSKSEQIKAFEGKTQENQQTEQRFTRERFVREFLRFTGEVAYSVNSGSGGSRGSRGMYWQLRGSSNPVPIATAEDSPQMGAMIGGNFIEYRKRRLMASEKTLLREITTATVYVGALATTQWGTRLHGAEPVLHVFSDPRLAFYKADGAETMTPLEASDPAWDEMTAFAEQLTEQKEALDNGRGRPIGWIS